MSASCMFVCLFVALCVLSGFVPSDSLIYLFLSLAGLLFNKPATAVNWHVDSTSLLHESNPIRYELIDKAA